MGDGCCQGAGKALSATQLNQVHSRKERNMINIIYADRSTKHEIV